jgi:hypothetical protein
MAGRPSSPGAPFGNTPLKDPERERNETSVEQFARIDEFKGEVISRVHQEGMLKVAIFVVLLTLAGVSSYCLWLVSTARE